MTQVLSSDFKKTPVYFRWNFLIYWSAITNFKMQNIDGTLIPTADMTKTK